jgi:DNA polymerase epsilon subunit 3
MADETLPQAHIKRIVKAKLAELTAGEDADKKRDITIQKEALVAFAESAKIFIHYLTATANDVCHDAKRLTINADDVMKAIDEIEFSEFAEPLREALAGAWRDGARAREGLRHAAGFGGKHRNGGWRALVPRAPARGVPDTRLRELPGRACQAPHVAA